MTAADDDRAVRVPSDPIVEEQAKAAAAQAPAPENRDETIITRHGPKWAWEVFDDALARADLTTPASLFEALFAINTDPVPTKRKYTKKQSGAK